MAKSNQLHLNATEKEMLDEVFHVMNKYKGVRKFGLQLSRSHFNIKKGEILYETHDENERTLSLRPVKKSSLDDQGLDTSWELDQHGKLVVTCICCVPGITPPKKY